MTIGDQLRPESEADAISDVIDKRAPAAARPASKTRRRLPGWLRINRRRAFVLAAIAAALILSVVFVLPRLTGSATSNLILAPVTRGDIETTVTALGNIQPKNYVDVGAQVSGQIKALHVAVGDQVKKGDLLAEIDAQVQQARVEADNDNLNSLHSQLTDKQAQLALKQAQYDRQVRLDKAGATSKDDLQTAKAALDSQNAQIEALRAQIKQAQSTLHGDQVTLGYATIVAPMDGTIVSLQARLGQTINSVQQAPTLLRIADLSLMQVWTQVSEADVAKLKVGIPAYFTTLGNPNRRYNGTLDQILPTPETVNNVILYDVLFDAPNPDGSLMTQMTAQVFFVTASAKNALMVPAAAVQPLSGRGFRRPGRTGQSTAGRGGPGAAQGQTTQQGDPGQASQTGQPPGQAGQDEQSGQPARAGQGRPRGAQGSEDAGAGGARGNAGGRAAFAATHGTVEVVTNGKIERRMIETGVTDRVNTEIETGLEEGEQVVVGLKQPGAETAAAAGSRPGGRSPLQGISPRGGRRFR